MKKKIIALLSAMALLSTAMPIVSLAAVDKTKFDIFFEAEYKGTIGTESDGEFVADLSVGTQGFETLTGASGTGTGHNTMNIRAMENVIGSEGKVTFRFMAEKEGLYELSIFGTPATSTYSIMSKVFYSINGSAPVKVICGDKEMPDTAKAEAYDAGVNLAKNTILNPVQLKKGENFITLTLDSSKLNALKRVTSYLDCIGFKKLSTEPTYELNLAHKLSDAAAEGETGRFRFITQFNLTGDAPEVEAFGTYILPGSIFDGESFANGAVVTYDDAADAAAIKDGDTYTADLTDIPQAYFGEKLYAASYVKFKGEDNVHLFNIVIDNETAKSVNDFIQ